MATKTETNLTTLNINYLSENDYNTALTKGQINENEIYMTPTSGITALTIGSGNAVTSISASDNTLTVAKKITFPTLDKIYPVGSIYMSANSTNSGDLFG